MEERLPCAHNHNAHPNHNAAGASEKTPITEIRLIATSGAEMIANSNFHRFHETKQTAKAAASQTAAITLDVIQSQVTTGDSLFAEQPQGLDAITKTDSRTAPRAPTPKAKAMTLVVRISEFAGASETNELSLFVAEEWQNRFLLRKSLVERSAS
jgi:hypothetical protein